MVETVLLALVVAGSLSVAALIWLLRQPRIEIPDALLPETKRILRALEQGKRTQMTRMPLRQPGQEKRE